MVCKVILVLVLVLVHEKEIIFALVLVYDNNTGVCECLRSMLFRLMTTEFSRWNFARDSCSFRRHGAANQTSRMVILLHAVPCRSFSAVSLPFALCRLTLIHQCRARDCNVGGAVW